MNRFRSLPHRYHGVHWVMLIVLVLHALAPHGGWRQGVSAPRPDLLVQTLPLHDSDGPKCQASAPPPKLPALAMATVLAPVFTLLPSFGTLPPGAGVVYAYPWPNAPPVRHG